MSIPNYTKQPGETIDIDVECLGLASTDTILTASSVADSGLTLGTASINTTTKIAKQRVSGGIAGDRYKVTMTITSVDGLVKEADFYVKVKEL